MIIGTSGKGRAWKKNGVNILHLRGTTSEMAAQHGALLRDEIRKGAIPALARKNRELVQYAPALAGSKILTTIAMAALRVLESPLSFSLEKKYKEESYHLAKAAGLDWRTVEQASLQADLLVLLLSHGMRKHMIRDYARGLISGTPGCTSAVSLSQHTAGGGLVHGRNFDYPFVGSWDTYPTVFYSDADDGQRVISLQTAGVHTIGITSANESGLVLSVHFHCSTKVAIFGGNPVHIIGSEIMRRARTIGEAIDIMKRYERAGSWSFVISSAKENRAVTLEVANGQMAIRDADDFDGKLVTTNMYRTPEMHDSEIFISCAVADDFTGRYNRAKFLLDHYTKDQKFTVQHMARILGDNVDHASGELRGHGNTISVVTTVTSIIAQMANNRLYLANRAESPVSLGDYVGFDVDEDFKNFDDKELELLHWDESTGGPAKSIRNTNKEEGLRAFRKAYMAYHNHFNWAEAAAHLEKAVTADPQEGHYRLALGHMYMRLSQPQKALLHFEHAQTPPSSPLSQSMKQTLQIFYAHALDATGQRARAVAQYEILALYSPLVSPQIKREAKKGLKRPYNIRRAQKITFDFQYCDSFDFA